MEEPKLLQNEANRVYPIGGLILFHKVNKHVPDGDTARQWLFGDGQVMLYSNGEEIYHGN